MPPRNFQAPVLNIAMCPPGILRITLKFPVLRKSAPLELEALSRHCLLYPFLSVHIANVLSVEIAGVYLRSQSKNKDLLSLQIFVCD